jgi:hypothetical protein
MTNTQHHHTYNCHSSNFNFGEIFFSKKFINAAPIATLALFLFSTHQPHCRRHHPSHCRCHHHHCRHCPCCRCSPATLVAIALAGVSCETPPATANTVFWLVVAFFNDWQPPKAWALPISLYLDGSCFGAPSKGTSHIDRKPANGRFQQTHGSCGAMI